MMFRNGSKIEVLRRITKQTSSWFPGRITSVDSNQYTVKYEQFLNHEGKLVIEKVNHEVVRPQPPTTKKEGKWMVGDIAEVFDTHSWRTGKVVKVLKSNRVVIKLSGSIQLKEFHQFNLRIRHSWQNFKWNVIEEGIDNDRGISGTQEEVNSRENEDREHPRTVKRSHDYHFDDAVMEMGTKRKVTTKVGGSGGIPRFSKHLDAIALPEVHAGKRCTLGFSDEMKNRRKYSVPPLCMATEDSNGCSVASCSGNLRRSNVQAARKSFKDIVENSGDDAESLCPPLSLCKYVPSEDALEANVRGLEIHAYRRTLQALYASGPLSWEQESLLTNLRLSLHISNEEHLLLLRQLLSIC